MRPCLQSLRHGERARAWGGRKRKCAIPVSCIPDAWLTSCCGVWAAAARRRGAHNRRRIAIAQRTRSVFNRSSGSPCGLCVMQFDVPNANPHISIKSSRPRCGWLVPPPPRGMPVPRSVHGSVCVRLLCATGLRDEARDQGTRAEQTTRQSHRTNHDRGVRRLVCVCCSRGLGPANLAGRCGIPNTRDNEGVSQK